MTPLIEHPALKQFFNAIRHTDLEDYEEAIRSGLTDRFNQYTHGHTQDWIQLVSSLPTPDSSHIDLIHGVAIQSKQPRSPIDAAALKTKLLKLHPWRKGPYHIDDITIDCEWRSDWKWDRIVPHLNLKNKTILDIGCGNGYHTWRMLGAGAKLTLGIDPSQLFWMQFLTIKHFLGEKPAYFLPIGIEHLPEVMPVFDTVFSMGVLYHRKSPINHLYQIKNLLRPNGEMVLETLVIDGDAKSVLVPGDRYACMPNVWFIPSVQALLQWVSKAGFSQVRCVDVSDTSIEEQRSTEWMTYQSLKDYLNPNDPSLTIEGYPAPKRAVIIAQK